MIRPSEFLDKFDKAFDLVNLWVDTRKQNIIDEIFWIEQNYENINSLRRYILKCAGFKDEKMNELYSRQLLAYPDAKVQSLAEVRANFLYRQLQNMQNIKIENKPLKIIVCELKLQGR